MLPMTTIYPTFFASLKSIGTAATLASVGIYLHRRGFIESEGKRTLALLSQQVTFPLYLFTQILYCNQDWSDKPCPDVTQSLKDVWMLLFWPLYVVGTGIFVGWLVTRVTNTPRKQVRAVIAACAFGNSTGLPITLLAVIHANFSSDSDLGRIDPSLFLSVYLILYPALQWGLGGWLLAPDFDDSISDDIESVHLVLKDDDEEKRNDTDDTWKSQIRSSSLERGNVSKQICHNVLNNPIVNDFYKSHRRGLSSADEGLYISEVDLQGLLKEKIALEAVMMSQRPLEEEQKNPDIFDMPDQLNTSFLSVTRERSASSYGSITNSNARIQSFRHSQSHHGRYKLQLNFDVDSALQSVKNIIDRCFQPPVIGSLLGILAAVTPIRGLFVDIVDRSSHAPLQWLFDGLYSVGKTAVPINMMILGCNLSWSSKKGSADVSDEDATFSNRTLYGILIGKMLFHPIIGILSGYLLKYYVLTIPEDIDGSFYLVLMIVFLCPTANNVMVMVELSGSNVKEGIARVIALQYAFAPILLTFTMTVAIGVASSWS